MVVRPVVSFVALALAGALSPLGLRTPASGEALPPGAPAPSGAITVRVAGDRDPLTGLPQPLAGVPVRAFTDAGLSQSAGECTTDGAGTCTMSGLDWGTYHVAPTAGSPDGDFAPLGTVATSFGPMTYAEAVVVDEGAPTTRHLVLRRANPPLTGRCGVRVTLLYDVSGSISADEARTMESASLEFVDALAGSPSAIAVASFATAAPAAGNQDLLPTSVESPTGVATVKAAVSALTRPGGDDRYTNWDAAFRSVLGEGDVVVLFTDGNPTVHGVPAVFPPVVTDLDQIDAGVLSANAVKAAGSRVVAVGVGDVDALSPENLAAVSGPVEGVDYTITSFADVAAVFRRLARELCPHAEIPVPVPAPQPAPQPAPAPQSPLLPPAAEPVPASPRFTG